MPGILIAGTTRLTASSEKERRTTYGQRWKKRQRWERREKEAKAYNQGEAEGKEREEE
jgi:hypothetical protein